MAYSSCDGDVRLAVTSAERRVQPNIFEDHQAVHGNAGKSLVCGDDCLGSPTAHSRLLWMWWSAAEEVDYFGCVFWKADQNVRLKAKLTKMSANAPIRSAPGHPRRTFTSIHDNTVGPRLRVLQECRARSVHSHPRDHQNLLVISQIRIERHARQSGTVLAAFARQPSIFLS